jgi:threonine dehydrogenase-like Zn-dependent dehydrogenase
LSRGDDLARPARGQRPRQPGQRRARQPVDVAHQAADQHPRAHRPDEQHAQREDQRRVDLHVEAGTARGRRPGPPRDPAVDGIEGQRDGGEQGRRGERLAGDDGGQRVAGDPGGEHGAGERDLVGGTEPDPRPGLRGDGAIDDAHTLHHVASHRPVRTARAFWVTAPGRGEIRSVDLPEPGPGDVVVRTLASGVSRGTETLVFRGEVPPSQYAEMRAPFQCGTFPAPVEYGYLNVGVVEQGPPDLEGRTVFALVPHRTRYVVPADALVPVPDAVPPGRAVLAGAMETAVNALWDAGPLVGDRITVVGGGMVGCCVAYLAGRLPGADVELVDVDPARAEVAARLGVRFAAPEEARADRDLVVHASASQAGLRRALELAGLEATVLELSWYGDHTVGVPLGEAFHSRRLDLRSSQVGLVAPARRARRSTRDRLALALDLLTDPALDVLITGESRFDELPDVLPRLAAGDLPAICHRIRYEEG